MLQRAFFAVSSSRYLIACSIAVFASAANLRAAEFLLRLSQPATALSWQVPAGSTAVFDSIDAFPVTGDQFEWYFNDTLIGSTSGAQLSLSNVTSANSGNYRAKLVRATGEVIWSHTTPLNVIAPPTGALDRSFSVNRPFAPMAVFNDGRILSAGHSILLSDGSDDPSFPFPVGVGSVLATTPDGVLLTSKPPYRLHLDGSSDSITLPAGFDSTQPLTDAVVQSDGRFVIAQGTQLARINADGTLDLGFVFSNPNGHLVDWLRVDPQDRILIHTRITEPNAISGTTTRRTLFRLQKNGGLDLSFGGANGVSFVSIWSTDFADFTELTPLLDGTYLITTNIDSDVQLRRMGSDGTFLNWDASALRFALNHGYSTNGSNLLFSASSGTLHRYLITSSGLELDPSFYPGLPNVESPWAPNFYSVSTFLRPDGDLFVVGYFTGWDGLASAGVVRMHGNASVAVPAVAYIKPSTQRPHAGAVVSLDCISTAGTGPFTYEWLALDGQPLPSNRNSATLIFSNFAAENLHGRYQVRVTGSGGTTLSDTFSFAADPQPTYLSNLSGRAISGAGEDVAIVGFTSGFTAGLPFFGLLRGAGPALNPLGVTHFLPDPILQLYSASGSLLVQVDNWANADDITPVVNRTGAFAFATGSKDAALTRFFERGNYTAQLRDTSGANGVGLLEIYFDPNPVNPFNEQLAFNSPLVNLSLRARTGPGEATAIAGFVIVDPLGFGRPSRVLLRAVGPTLANQGIVHPLSNPVLTVFDNKGHAIAQNDDWGTFNTSGDPAALSAAMKQVGAFELPTNSKDSALLLDLPASPYTIHATGGEGVVLLEIYLVR